MIEWRDVMTEIDFVTYGIKPKGELWRRASKVLSDFDKWEAKLDQREDLPLEAACRLIQTYVKGQEVIFKTHGVPAEDWLAKRLVRTLMNACLQRPLRKSLEFKDQIEDAASGSELYAVALGIIREYESYCSQRAKIDKHIEAQRKKINSNREEFLIALEKRDGLFCKGCGSVENLLMDHKIPLSLGGSSVLENLQLLCSFCNGSKGNRPMDYLYKRVNKSRMV